MTSQSNNSSIDRSTQDRHLGGYFSGYFDEPGVVFTGGPGCGKSLALRHWIRCMQLTGRKHITLDGKGKLRAATGKHDSVTLNPLDAGSTPWDLMGEIRSQSDLVAVAHALYPMTPHGDPFADGARAILTGMLEASCSGGDLKSFLSMDLDELRSALANTSASVVLSHGGDRGVMVMLQKLKRDLSFLCIQDHPGWAGKAKFSLTDWVRDEQDKRDVYLCYEESQLPAINRLLVLCIEITIRRLLERTDAASALNPQCAFVGLAMDDFQILDAPIPSLEKLVTNYSRVFATWALVTQDRSQLERIYGSQACQAIFDSSNVITEQMCAARALIPGIASKGLVPWPFVLSDCSQLERIYGPKSSQQDEQ